MREKEIDRESGRSFLVFEVESKACSLGECCSACGNKAMDYFIFGPNKIYRKR